MLHKYIADVNELRIRLKEQGKDYLLSTELPASKACLQVEGKFAGQSVVWNMSITTIEQYGSVHPLGEDPKQFINIEHIDGVYHIEIGLNIRQIDLPVIERTIIMVRKYKRLRLGRYEYGARSKTA